ncbi:MAG: glycosyltransferase family 4 protein, partial [Candidatus Omnitrophota bacterium]|nr:glycosyltransferase family 4 protein [Candidatus Omnitrophota bacterium]
LITTHLNIGGIGSYVTSLAGALQQRGHEIFVASSGGRLKNLLLRNRVKHVYLDIKTKSEFSPKIIRSFFALKSFLKQEKIDVIHAHTRVTQALSALLSSFTGISYVTTCHGFFKRRVGRRIFGCWGARTIAISEAVQNHLTGDFGVDEKKIDLIHTGIEPNRFLREAPQSEKQRLKLEWGLDNGPVIGAIGRLSSVKGQDVLIRAAELIIHDFPALKVLLVGDGPDESRLKKLSSGMGMDNRVIFAGSIDDTAKIFPVIDIFVQPSLKEGLGLSLLEAMASRKPCIASRTGGIGSLIEDGVTGVLVKPGSHRELARAIKNIIADKNLTAVFGKNGREKVLSGFTIDEMVLKVEKAYEEAITHDA